MCATGTGTSVRVVLCAELRYFMMINLVLADGVAGALPSAESEPFGVAQLKSQATHILHEPGFITLEMTPALPRSTLQ